MVRTYDFQSMVELPKTDAATTATLVTAIIVVGFVAKKEKLLASNVAKGLGRLEGRRDELNDALRDGLGPDIDAGSASAVDRTAASAWAGTHAWAQGWRRIPAGGEHALAAERIEERIFPDGLRFLRFAPARRWAEGERRLAHIDEHKLGADFALLGGSVVLATLRATHRALGDAVGATAPRAQPPAPQIRERLDAVKAALRYYVFQVTAQVDPDDAATAELADRLLEPLRSYQSVAYAAKARPAVAVVAAAKESGDQSAPTEPGDPSKPKKPE